MKCKNCGHHLYEVDCGLEHWTRAYRPWGYPYTTVKCHAPGCKCEKPEAEVIEE